MARLPATFDQWDSGDERPDRQQESRESRANTAYRRSKQAILDGGLAPMA